jgi:CheY-like chemotaxis protein
MHPAKAMTKRRILVVDDDRDILESTALVLRTEGYDVLTVDSGGSVIDVVRRGRPDLVLLDMRMPGMSGAEVCASLKGDPELAGIPIVAFSADCGVAERLGEINVAAFLQKPFEFDDLIRTIERCVA